MIQKIIKCWIIGVLGMVLLIGCMPKREDQQIEIPKENTITQNEKKPSDDFIQISMQNPITLHPIYNMDKTVQQALYLVFDTLVNIEPDGSVTPRIATHFNYDPQDYSVTIRLRDDIKWHDGSPLTSEDVVFSVQTIKEATESAYKLTTQNIANIQALDAQTVKIIYRQPFSGVYQTLFFPVIPRHIYDKPREEALKILPLGSGAYRYATHTPHKELTLEANEAYFLTKPKINTIKIMITPDEASQLDAFEQNLIDVIYTDIMDWGKYAKDKSATIYEMNTNCYEFIGLNFNRPLFQNKQIREALVYGLDRQGLLQAYYLGHGILTDTPIGPDMYFYDQTLDLKAFDKEKAKLLLVQEGYVFDPKTKLFTKNNTPIQFKLLVNKENKDRMYVAQGIQRMYKEIGIDVIIDEVDRQTFVERLYNKQYEAFLGGWKLSYVPDFTFAFHSSQQTGGDNFISYSSDKMDELLAQAFRSSPAEIKEVYSQLQRFIAEENPYISLYFRRGALITKKKITGPIEPDPLNIYSNIQVWEIKD